MKKELFTGVCTALVTPFLDDGEIDYSAFERLINRQINSHIDAILILGTTGEASTISYQERGKLIKLARKTIPQHIKLLIGTGCNSTKFALKYTLQAQKLGADGVMLVTPYYNKCSQKGAFEHYKYIIENSNIPIILYNVPSRTGFNLAIDTIKKLSTFQNIVGIKEASSNLSHIKQELAEIKNMAIYSGNDDLNELFLTSGASGVVSVLSNVYPKLVKDICQKISKNCTQQKEFSTLKLFNQNLFVDVNPIPVKYVLFKMGLIKYNFRLPLTRLEKKDEIILDFTFNLNN